MIPLETASLTDVGRVRKRNEDAYHNDPANGVWVVADGMGGHDAGDVASATVVDAMRTVGKPASADDLLGRVQHRLGLAHERLVRYARERKVALVGAAVVVLLVFERYVACVWSGDSRLYVVRDGSIRQLNRDHSEVGELLSRGVISPEEAAVWRGRNAITRAVGVHETLELEAVYDQLCPGDVFVLCSDGLTRHVGDEEIRVIAAMPGAESAVAALIRLALDRGGEDNVTATVVRAVRSTGRDTILRPSGAAGTATGSATG